MTYQRAGRLCTFLRLGKGTYGSKRCIATEHRATAWGIRRRLQESPSQLFSAAWLFYPVKLSSVTNSASSNLGLQELGKWCKELWAPKEKIYVNIGIFYLTFSSSKNLLLHFSFLLFFFPPSPHPPSVILFCGQLGYLPNPQWHLLVNQEWRDWVPAKALAGLQWASESIETNIKYYKIILET